MASPSAIARRAGRTLLLASVIPMSLFYSVLSFVGLSVAIGATVAWYYICLLARLVRRKPVVGATVLGAALMSVRAIVAFWTGSAYLYFLQPIAGTIATATALTVTALAGRPLLERLAHDFLPLPPALTERLHATRYFRYTSALWSLMYVLNAVGTLWLLSRSSIGAFLLIKTLMSPVLTGTTIVISYLLFKRLMRRENVLVRWRGIAPAVPVAVTVPV